jgi:hypothetical protein
MEVKTLNQNCYQSENRGPLFVGIDQLKDYIETFLRYFTQLTNLVDREIKEKTFPKFLRFPYKINGIISSIHGISIEFVEESNDYSLSISMVNRPIEDAILPQKNPKIPCLEIADNRFIDIVNGIFVTKEFREKYVTEMTGGLICQSPIDGFVHVSTGGDVKFHNSQFGAIIAGKPLCKKTGDCLWIYGSNRAEDFTVEKARTRALEEFNVYLATHIHQQFKIGLIDERRKTIDTMTRKIANFEKLISKAELDEKADLQSYFESNPEFLFFGTKYRKIFPHITLKREGKSNLIPDFLLEHVTDGYCDILDIKLPDKKLLAGRDERRRFSYEVEDAIAQVSEYREYFNDPSNRENIEKTHGIKIYKPNILVLVGDSTNIDVEELIRIRDRRKDGEVITYSDIVRQMKALLDFLKA